MFGYTLLSSRRHIAKIPMLHISAHAIVPRLVLNWPTQDGPVMALPNQVLWTHTHTDSGQLRLSVHSGATVVIESAFFGRDGHGVFFTKQCQLNVHFSMNEPLHPNELKQTPSTDDQEL